MMIGYVTVGTNDLPRSIEFYEALATGMGAGRMMEGNTYVAWGTPGGSAGICTMRPFDGETASVGNGMMVALAGKDEAQVQRLHEIALAKGGSCEGKPGLRGGGFYAAYFRDPDGNKLNAYCMVAE